VEFDSPCQISPVLSLWGNRTSHSWTWTTSITRTHPLFPFLSKLGGLGGTCFYHSPEHYIPWIDKSGSNNEKRVLLQVSQPVCCEAISKYYMQSGFKVRSRHFWPYPTSQHQRCPKKKLKMSTWKWHPDARCPTHRVKVGRYAAMQLTHLSRDIQKHVVISLKSREPSRTFTNNTCRWPFWNFISLFVFRSSFDPSFFPNKYFWFPQSRPAYRTVRVIMGVP